MSRGPGWQLVCVVLLLAGGCGATPAVEGTARATEFSAAATAPPGADLPSSQECARRTTLGPEPRPENTVANRTMPPAGYRVADWPTDGYAPEFNARIVPRVEGRFTGTTDQILAWGACRWGMPADVVRAMAVEESTWVQSHTGDVSDDARGCVGGDEPPCPTSFGILQLKALYRPGSWPWSLQSTAFNVDYGLGAVRGCFEGWVTYLRPNYKPGDLWGCLGWHFSGEWHDPPAQGYIRRVKAHLRAKPWTQW